MNENTDLYQSLNDNLLSLIFLGKSETEEAYKVRHQMDDIWDKMSEHEQDLNRQICEGRLDQN
jgi:hypothetical protein